jgi:alkylated DNA nucleotide flippase Atl1
MQATATIQRLYLKRARGEAGVASTVVHCTAGVGIDGDAHANRLSPRQVLVTLASELDSLGIAPGALMENLVIACDRPALFRPGAALVGASGVEIRLTMFCEPCRRIAHLAPRLSGLLHRRGVLGVVVAGGALRVDESIALVADRYPALPESPYQKFLDFLPTVPCGRVVRYADVAIAMGVADSFVRALPGYIRRSAGGDLPLHRIVNARGGLLDIVPDQAKKLQAEGVAILGNSASLQKYAWQGPDQAALLADSGRPQ